MPRHVFTCVSVLALLFLTAGRVSAQSFAYPNFSSTAGLVLNGAAAQSGSDLRLTPNALQLSGSAWYGSPVSAAGGFDAYFDFRISAGGADGMAFVIQADPLGTAALGFTGGELGYGGGAAGTGGTGVTQALAIEIDTYPNGWPILSEPAGNEISVHVHQGSHSPDETYSIGRVTPGAVMADGNVHTMRVSYAPGILQVYLDDLVNPLLTLFYDVAVGGTYLNGQPAPGVIPANGCAWMGFTAGTGGLSASHDVLNWTATIGAALPEYQVNQPGASLDIDGIQGSACAPIRKTTCVSETSVLNLASATPATSWDLAITLSPLVPSSGAGRLLSDGQIVNVDIFQTIFLNSAGLLPNLLPFPASLSAPVTPTAPVTVAAQAIMLEPALPLGIALSAGVELNVVAVGATSVAGPTGDDVSVTVDVTTTPLCWCPSGIPFFGTSYSSIAVASNGRVVFGAADDDFTSTVVEALTDSPFVGSWSDYSPNVAGTITLSSPAPGITRVDFVGVPYFGSAAALNTFGIEFNCVTGDVQMDGLTGLVADPGGATQFLGLSPGTAGPATDPGAVAFSVGGVGAAGAATDMLYDYGSGIAPSLVPGTLNTILWTPDGGGNYVWFGF